MAYGGVVRGLRTGKSELGRMAAPITKGTSPSAPTLTLITLTLTLTLHLTLALAPAVALTLALTLRAGDQGRLGAQGVHPGRLEGPRVDHG